MTILQRNSLAQLGHTLQDFSTLDRQRQYKSAVPFVHVPIELIAQWDNHARMVREVAWFAILFSADELEAIASFDALVNDAWLKMGPQLPDVPEILEDARWIQLSRDAGALARRLASSLSTVTGN